MQCTSLVGAAIGVEPHREPKSITLVVFYFLDASHKRDRSKVVNVKMLSIIYACVVK